MVKFVDILVATEQSLMRRGLTSLFQGQADWRMVGETRDIWAAVIDAGRFQPAIVIAGVTMPQLDELNAVRVILQSFPRTQVLVLSSDSTWDVINKCLQAGIRGFVLQGDAETDLVPAIETLLEGKVFLSSGIAGREQQSPSISVQMVTERMRQIITLLAQGKSSQEIASVLGISKRTVEKHRVQIMQRLGLASFSALVRYAIRSGMLEP